MHETLLLTKPEVEKLLTMREAIDVMEQVFADAAKKVAITPFESRIKIPENHGGFSVKSGYLKESNLACIKVASAFDKNKEMSLPTVLATILLLDAKTGFPISIMDGTLITAIRTGATGAMAAKHLARKGSSVVGVIGTGTQAKMQVLALNEVFHLTEVIAYSPTRSSREKFSKEIGDCLKVKSSAVESPELPSRKADILVTATTSRKPIVEDSWIRDGTHINSFGTDSTGKQELDRDLYLRSKIVTDDYAIAAGKNLFPSDRIHAELGEVIIGKKSGRSDDFEITIFDSTGIGIQDAAAAKFTYEKAKKLNVGKWINLL